VLSSYISLTSEATRQRLDALARYFIEHGVSDAALARREALVYVGRAIRHQAFLMGFSDSIVMQSAALLAALCAVVLLKKAPRPSGPPTGSH
jgi:DHA2 family multidrug resistance protein